MLKMCVVALALVITASAHAACGGGGFSAKKPVPAGATTTAPVAGTTTAAVTTAPAPAPATAPVPAPAPVAAPVASGPGWSSKYDMTSSKLSLSSDQYDHIANARKDVQKRESKLMENQQKAQAELDKKGDEKRAAKLKAATDELKSYDPYKDFDTKLEGILNADQMAIYRK